MHGALKHIQKQTGWVSEKAGSWVVLWARLFVHGAFLAAQRSERRAQ